MSDVNSAEKSKETVPPKENVSPPSSVSSPTKKPDTISNSPTELKDKTGRCLYPEKSEISGNLNIVSQVKNKEQKEDCCYRKDYLEFGGRLIWPSFFFLLLILFHKELRKLINGLIDLVPHIQGIKAGSVEFTVKKEDESRDEFIKDVEETNQNDDASPIEEIKQSLKEAQAEDVRASIRGLAKLKVEIELFEEAALASLKKLLNREIVTGKGISINGRKLTADGFFTHEGTFWIVEVKLIKRVNTTIITQIVGMMNELNTKKRELSKMTNMSIVEVRGILIISEEAIIPPIVLNLIRSHQIHAYYFNKDDEALREI